MSGPIGREEFLYSNYLFAFPYLPEFISLVTIKNGHNRLRKELGTPSVTRRHYQRPLPTPPSTASFPEGPASVAGMSSTIGWLVAAAGHSVAGPLSGASKCTVTPREGCRAASDPLSTVQAVVNLRPFVSLFYLDGNGILVYLALSLAMLATRSSAILQ